MSDDQPQSPLTLNVRDSARHSGLPRDYLYRSLDAGTLRAIRVGRVWRVPVTELEEFVRREARRRKA